MVDIARLRERLLQQKQELLVRAQQIRDDMTRSSGPLDPDFAEQVVQLESDAVLSGIGDAAAAELRQINRALKRMDEGNYGECAVCGQPIDTRRLEVLPYSDRCVRCAEFAP